MAQLKGAPAFIWAYSERLKSARNGYSRVLRSDERSEFPHIGPILLLSSR